MLCIVKEMNMKRFVVAPLFLLFFVPAICFAANAASPRVGLSKITGQFLTDSGQPLSNGIVSFFSYKNGMVPSFADGTFRVPEMIGKVNAEGMFTVRLLPGTYYLGAMISENPRRGPGPPKKGEPYYFANDKQGNYKVFTVEADAMKDLGKISSGAAGSFPTPKNLATIEGKIVRESGQPLEDSFVLVKIDLGVFRQLDRPDYVSNRTDKEGRYSISLPPGKYYILCRQNIIGGRPHPGDFVGIYGKKTSFIDQAADKALGNIGSGLAGDPDAGGSGSGPGFQDGIGILQTGEEAVVVELKAGESLKGIDITVYEVPDPIGTREKIQEQTQSNVFFDGPQEQSGNEDHKMK